MQSERQRETGAEGRKAGRVEDGQSEEWRKEEEEEEEEGEGRRRM